jgi:hypothetical protein
MTIIGHEYDTIISVHNLIDSETSSFAFHIALRGSVSDELSDFSLDLIDKQGKNLAPKYF